MSADDHKNAMVRKHFLLTVLGKDPKPAHYTLEGRQAEAAPLAPVALLDLLPKKARPDHVLALCTPEAKQESWPLLEQALAERYRVESVEVPSGDREQDVNRFLAKVSEAIPEKIDLTVDVTHGFRHFSFLTYIAVLYLAALRDVNVRGAYYGMLNRDAPSPFLDLRPLLELPGWVYSLEVLHDTGSALPMAKILANGPPSQPTRNNARDLTHLSEAYLSGLPLEIGWQAWNIQKCRRKPLKKLFQTHHLPLKDQLVQRLMDLVEPFVRQEPLSVEGWKRHVEISKPELERQARIIDRLLAHENYAAALGLMREWMVSWVIYRRGSKVDWLNHGPRREAEGFLHAIKAVGGDKSLRDALTEEQGDLGCFWANLAEVRNAYAHHGMRGEDLVRDHQFKSKLKRVLGFWEKTLRPCPEISLSLRKTPNDRVLISPIGLQPGVLFSAIHACRTEIGSDPNLVMVICSTKARDRIEEALEHAEYSEAVELLMLNDAFGDSKEIEQMAQDSRRHFVGASEVLVNITGGTTLMGLAAERLANEARSLACPARRFGLIDRRPPSEQESDPYQAGEPFWLDLKDNTERWQS